MKRISFLKRYVDKDKKVQEYMSFIADALIEKHQEIPETFVISLDLLAQNLEIMIKSSEDMNKQDGMTDDDRYHGKKKSASLQTYFQAQGYINTILTSFGLNPMAKSKMKKNQDEVNIDQFLEQITA